MSTTRISLDHAVVLALSVYTTSELAEDGVIDAYPDLEFGLRLALSLKIYR